MVRKPCDHQRMNSNPRNSFSGGASVASCRHSSPRLTRCLLLLTTSQMCRLC